MDQLDLPPEVRLARLDLVRLRIAVSGGPAFQDVRDVHVRSRQADSGQQLVEQLARGTDKRDSLLVLVEAGGFPHEHQVGVRIAGAEDDLRPAAGECALRAA